MKSRISPRRRQRGMSFWSLLYLLFTLGFYVLLGMKILPLYLNQMKIAEVVRNVAQQAKADDGQIDAHAIQLSLEKRWDIEDIDTLDYHDVQVATRPRGRVLAYNYDAVVNLFYNINVSIHFQDEVLIPGTAGG